jgi:exonuclease SbcD
MRFIHTSDLHIGKKVHGHSMIADQEFILNKITSAVRTENADGLMIAGDVYDRSVPSEDAVDLFDRFLTDVSELCPVYIIAGNHDSAERLSFGRNIMRKQGVHITDTFSGRIEKVVLCDEHGPLSLYLLPFIKPSIVRQFFENETTRINTPDDAMKAAIGASGVDPKGRNILIAHQFIVGSGIELSTTESEESKPVVGGVDCISFSLLDPFDYVALGHIHRPQSAGRPTVRYSGSPLKDSTSEVHDVKSVSVVEIEEKGNVSIRTVPLVPLRDAREIRGTVEELMSPDAYNQGNRDDYIFATVTRDSPDIMAKLNAIYPNLMELVIQHEVLFGTDSEEELNLERVRKMTPLELFREFFRNMNGSDLTEEQEKIFSEALENAQKEASS